MTTAFIIFSCVAVNHLGLVAAIEKVIRHNLPVLNCPKCLTFWSVLTYRVAVEINSSLFTLNSSLQTIAVAFLCSYVAIWLELFMYAIDTLYNNIYGKIEDYDPEEDGRATH